MINLRMCPYIDFGLMIGAELAAISHLGAPTRVKISLVLGFKMEYRSPQFMLLTSYSLVDFEIYICVFKEDI